MVLSNKSREDKLLFSLNKQLFNTLLLEVVKMSYEHTSILNTDDVGFNNIRYCWREEEKW